MESKDLAKEVTELHADLCSALADPKRILLLYALSEHSQKVNELADRIGISQPAASRHLKILRERGLVRSVRQGASVEYHLVDPRLIEALDILRSVLSARIHHRANLLVELDSE
ncbi:MAG TPA: metalloregulator ArsR/SmtB family transcription factor [Anaerolineales bacterium]|nr:metalloregulator ArsR/SmtB family transcription factor [Anaerolineales bacterium]